MKRLIVVAALIGLTACGAYRFPGGGTTSGETGTVTGQVLTWPCAPVENPQIACKGRPVTGLPVVFTSASGADVTAVTDAGGSYTSTLAAGTWKVSFKGYFRIISGPAEVTVVAGQTAVANYLLDSGIRVPVVNPAG
jgi:hypothetical protein